jgi:hypothetical protein
MATVEKGIASETPGVGRTLIHPKVMVDIQEGKPGGIVDLVPLSVLGLVWVAAASGTGFLLALLARRIHPGLSLVKLWFFYTVLMALLVAFVLLIGWF